MTTIKKISSLILITIISITTTGCDKLFDNMASGSKIESFNFKNNDFIRYNIELNDNKLFAQKELKIKEPVQKGTISNAIELTWKFISNTGLKEEISHQVYFLKKSDGYYEISSDNTVSTYPAIPLPLTVGSQITGKFGATSHESTTLIIQDFKYLSRGGKTYHCAKAVSLDENIIYYISSDLFIVEVEDHRYKKTELTLKNFQWTP